jgi:hypothetical protein
MVSAAFTAPHLTVCSESRLRPTCCAASLRHTHADAHCREPVLTASPDWQDVRPALDEMFQLEVPLHIAVGTEGTVGTLSTQPLTRHGCCGWRHRDRRGGYCRTIWQKPGSNCWDKAPTLTVCIQGGTLRATGRVATD